MSLKQSTRHLRSRERRKRGREREREREGEREREERGERVRAQRTCKVEDACLVEEALPACGVCD